MTMANTENTSEKKTIRKRARPLRGAGGTVTEEAKEKKKKNQSDSEPIQQWVNQSLVSDPTSGEPEP